MTNEASELLKLNQAWNDAIEAAAVAAEGLTVCMEWWEGHERSVRHPSPVETAAEIRTLLRAGSRTQGDEG